jgi:hypothetical protein
MFRWWRYWWHYRDVVFEGRKNDKTPGWPGGHERGVRAQQAGETASNDPTLSRCASVLSLETGPHLTPKAK